jgi:hypothetical protein
MITIRTATVGAEGATIQLQIEGGASARSAARSLAATIYRLAACLEDLADTEALDYEVDVDEAREGTVYLDWSGKSERTIDDCREMVNDLIVQACEECGLALKARGQSESQCDGCGEVARIDPGCEPDSCACGGTFSEAR